MKSEDGEMNKNFQQALNEVFTFKKGEKNPDMDTEEVKETEDITENITPAPAAEKLEASQESKGSNKGTLFSKKYVFEEKDYDSSQKTTVITEDTNITGTIVTNSKLLISGIVEGDIECKNTILTTGKIFGNIKCESAEIENAQVEGNINVENKLMIKSNSLITGDLSGKHIEISGIIKGNINAEQYIKLCGDAKVTGDISTSALSIEAGAALQGNVSVLTK